MNSEHPWGLDTKGSSGQSPSCTDITVKIGIGIRHLLESVDRKRYIDLNSEFIVIQANKQTSKQKKKPLIYG